MKMKSTTINALVILFALFASLFLASCDDDSESSSGLSEVQKKEQVNKVNSLRQDVDFINRFVNDNVLELSSEGDGGRTSFSKNLIARIQEDAPCTEGTEEELQDGSIKITLDFGDGCMTEEGIEVAGTVVMTFTFSDNTLEYAIEFIDYTELSGDNKDEVVNGTVGGSFVIDLEAGRFEQYMEQDLTVTYSNNAEASYKMISASELTEDGLRVSSLSTSGNFADGGVFAITVTKTLVYDFACESDYPVEGEERMTFQGNTVVVNYGDGTCDNTYSVK
jgi:outer membrane lipoprotein-sorting protein